MTRGPASSRGRRTGATFPDVVLTLAILVFVGVVVGHAVVGRSQARALAADLDSVERVRAQARAQFDSTGTWPAATDRHRTARGDTILLRRWTRVFEDTVVAERPNEDPYARLPAGTAPPATDEPAAEPDTDPVFTVARPVGVLSLEVRSTDPVLLAALLDRYGAGRAFLRDALFVLMLGPPPELTPPAS